MSNKSNGTAFEKEFAEMLSGSGFWVHLLRDNQNGQPFDMIAAKNGTTFVFDCKDCTSYQFDLTRVEENQKTAMALWVECKNREPLFILRFADMGIWVMTYTDAMDAIANGTKAVTRKNLFELATPFCFWRDEG